MSDAFAGAWNVRESVFDGAQRCGVVAQQRRLIRDGADRWQVIQDNTPDAALASHPMARFAGHHEFTLHKHGRRRHYLGPAVVGEGLDLGDGTMLGHGEWPMLGWRFTSWAFLVAPDRQLTGGRFWDKRTAVATIVGVAAPAPAVPAELDGEVDAPAGWAGTRRLLAPDGTPTDESRIQGWRPGTAPGGARESDELAGLHTITTLEVVDPSTRTWCAVRRFVRSRQLEAIEVLRLRPEGDPS
jgi:hypothetical protein